jgi:hypothetical protein
VVSDGTVYTRTFKTDFVMLKICTVDNLKLNVCLLVVVSIISRVFFRSHEKVNSHKIFGSFAFFFTRI